MFDPKRVAETLIRTDMRLCEAVLDLYAQLGIADPRDLYGDLDGMEPFPPGLPPLYRDSQGRGEVLPVYNSWLHLKYIRDRSRRLCADNEFAQCALQNRVNYVVGKGFTYKAVTKDETIDTSLADDTQEVLDKFIERNEWPEREAECLWRADRDGEFFLRFFPQDDGILAVRYVECEHIKDRSGDAGDPTESFGVETYPQDLETVVAYWVIENPYVNASPTRVESSSILHFKLNTGFSEKRGLPTLYPIEGNLRRAEDLLTSMTAMAKTRAKIAMIRKMAGVGRSAAQNLIDSTIKSAEVNDPSTGSTATLERLRYGTVLNSTDKIEYEFPHAQTDAGGFVEILQADLRGCAARLNMPEWMLSAGTNDANYATALVNEAPSVKNFEYLQRRLARVFGESNRPGARMSAMWRQIHHSVRLGLLPPEVLTSIQIQVECPKVSARDRQAEASLNQTYNQMGIKSLHTIASEEGLDYDQEQKHIAEETPVQEEVNPLETSAPDGTPGKSPDTELVQESRSMNYNLPNIIVQVPEQPAPIVNITVPEQAAPIINLPAPIVKLTLPKQDKQVINVEAPIINVDVPTPIVNVKVPEQKTPVVNVNIPEQKGSPLVDIIVERDKDGRPVRYKEVIR